MNDYCVKFMNEKSNEVVPTATHEEREKFIESVKELHANGYYLARSKDGFKASNKDPEKLKKQIDDLPMLIKATFNRI